MAGIHLLSSVPGNIVPEDSTTALLFILAPPALQNLLHIPLFAGLAWLWRSSLRAWMGGAWRLTWCALLLTIGYGIFDEWYQMTVPGRYASLTDVLFDAMIIPQNPVR